MSKKKAIKEPSFSIEVIKPSSLEEIEDKYIGVKGTAERDEYEKSLANDTATSSRVSEKAPPPPYSKYGPELEKALPHVRTSSSHILDGTGWNEESGTATDFLDAVIKDGHDKLFFVGWPVGYSIWLTHEMAKRNFAVNDSDTKYLRIAVKFAQNRTLKDTILVFSRRK